MQSFFGHYSPFEICAAILALAVHIGKYRSSFEGSGMAGAEEIVARYSRRAEELRTIAESVRDPEYSRALRDWASTYDHLVQRAVEVMSSYDGLQQEKRSVPGGWE
jgi:hypothetical protein